jgi:hypothetical protein
MDQVNFLSKLVALKPGKTVETMIRDVMLGKGEGADNTESTTAKPNSDLEPPNGMAGRVSFGYNLDSYYRHKFYI